MRFFRFHAWYGEGAPDAAGLHACIKARAGLDQLSRERVRMELLKLVLAPHATPTLAVMAEAGLLGTVLGGVPLLASFENMVKVEAAIGVEADAARRLGALGVQVMEDAERLAQRLRLSNAESERLLAFEYWWHVTPAAGERAAHALLYGLGPIAFTDRVLVAWTRSRYGRGRHRLARSCNAAAALAGAELPAAGRGLHPPRRAQGAGARRCHPRGRA